jgi:hypothetical protein
MWFIWEKSFDDNAPGDRPVQIESEVQNLFWARSLKYYSHQDKSFLHKKINILSQLCASFFVMENYGQYPDPSSFMFHAL